MLDIFYTYFDQVVQGNACEARPPRPQPGLFGNSLKSDQNADCCHALTLGLLINGFAPLGNCYLRVRATEVHTSPMGVYLTLSKIKFHSWREPVSDDEKNHTICNFMTEMRAKLDEAYQAMASPVLESHILHMKKQWAKGRTAP
jgi:hypothetical protein